MNAINKYGKTGAYQKITHYSDNFADQDELAWAACELFLATGSSQYQQKLFEWFPDPTDPASVLRTRISSREQGLYIEWNTMAGNYYQLQVTSDLSSWSNVATPRFAQTMQSSNTPTPRPIRPRPLLNRRRRRQRRVSSIERG